MSDPVTTQAASCLPPAVEPPKNPVGRPLKFQSVEELEVRINVYFDDCDKEYDTRKWTHEELILDEETNKNVCSNCFKRPTRTPVRSGNCRRAE
jgi:hypothetical protein